MNTIASAKCPRAFTATTTAPAAAHPSRHFCRDLAAAIRKLKTRLHFQYAELFHERQDLLASILAEAEELAWQTPFPHLFLPDFAEARVAELAPETVLAWAA